MKKILNDRKNEIEKNIKNYNIELSKINYLLEENNMKNEILSKTFQVTLFIIVME